MAKKSTGPTVRERTVRLLEALLRYTKGDNHHVISGIEYQWKKQNRLLVITNLSTLRHLISLDCFEGTMTTAMIRESLHRLEDHIQILEDHRILKAGSSQWHFTLNLWSDDIQTNLRRLQAEWDLNKSNSNPQKNKLKKLDRNFLRQHKNIKLPRQTNQFIGRQAELKRLLKFMSLEHRSPYTIVDGIGGVGKTALVLEAAYLCLEVAVNGEAALDAPAFDAIIFTSAKSDYLWPNGIVSISPRKRQSTLRSILRQVAATLDDQTITQTDNQVDQIERAYERLNNQRTLLIVDNLDTVEDKHDVLEFLQDLPPKAKGVVTSREREVYHVPIRLECLPKSESIQLIQQQLRDKQIIEERNLQLTYNQCKAIYERFGGIPVALIYVVGQLASGYTLDMVLNPSVSLPDDVARYCFEASVNPLRGQPAHHLLMSMAMFHRSPGATALTTVANYHLDSASPGLARLDKLSLIHQHGDRYRILPLTREFACDELVAYPSFEKKARKRWVDYYLNFVEANGRMDWDEWHFKYDNLEAEWPNLMAVLHWCLRHEHFDEILKIWRKINQFSSLYGYWHDRLYWLKWLLDIAERQNDIETAIYALSEKSYTLMLMGQLQEAESLLNKAYKFGGLADKFCQVFLYHHFAYLFIRKRDYDGAQNWLDQEEKLLDLNKERFHSQEEYHRRRIAIQYYRAEILYQSGYVPSAKEQFQEVIKISDDIHWLRKRIYAQNWLADIAIQEQDFDTAQKLLDTGIKVCQRNKDNRRTACYRSSFARLEFGKGNTDKACKDLSKAIRVFKRLGMRQEIEEMQTLQLNSCST